MPDNAKLTIVIDEGKGSSQGGGQSSASSPSNPAGGANSGGMGGGGGNPLAPAGYSPGGRSAGASPSTSAVPAFDRPIPVIIMGPQSLLDGLIKGAGQQQQQGPKHQPPSQQRQGRNWAQTWNQVGHMAQRAGQVGVGVARNEVGAVASAALDAATTGLSRLGPYGMAAAAALQAAGAGVKAFTQTVNAFVERGRELARFDSRLAFASGMADVKRMQADIKEAQQLGEGMSRLIEQQAELEVTVRELLLPVKEFVIDILADTMELLAEAARFFLRKDKEAKPEKLNAIMADFLGIADRIQGVGERFNDGADRAAAAKLGIPLLDL